MKNRNSVLNSMFKDRLDDNNKLKWDKICKNYTLDLVLNLFIWWISSKERYLRDNIFVSKWIVWKLKDRKNITYIKPENYRSFFTLFPLFYKFYQENWSNIQDLFCDDIYNEKKDNLKEYKDLEKIFEWQNFMEQDDSKQAKDYMNKLKYLYRIFPENELIDIFKLYINSAYRLHNLSNWYEDLLKWNKPFDIVVKDLDNDIIKKIGDIWKRLVIYEKVIYILLIHYFLDIYMYSKLIKNWEII